MIVLFTRYKSDKCPFGSPIRSDKNISFEDMNVSLMYKYVRHVVFSLY